MTKYGSTLPMLGDNKMQGRRQADTGGPIAAQQIQSELDLLFWEWLRTGLVVLEAVKGRRESIKGTGTGTVTSSVTLTL